MKISPRERAHYPARGRSWAHRGCKRPRTFLCSVKMQLLRDRDEMTEMPKFHEKGCS
jgi:hypothetical protein